MSLRQVTGVRFQLLALALACVLVPGLALPAAAGGGQRPSPPDTELADQLAARVTVAGAWPHLAALQRAADAHQGVRAAGTPGYLASARYVTERLRRAGYRVRLQPFSFPDSAPVAETARRLSPAPRTLHPLLARYSASLPDGGWTGLLALPPQGGTAAYGCEPDDYAHGDFRGRAVLLRYGRCDVAAKLRLAAAAGASAVLLNVDQQPAAMNIRSGVRPPSAAVLPVATLPRGESEQLIADAARGPVRLALDLRGRAFTNHTFNVLADTPTGHPGHTVVVGAHLDSATEGPGINDNGSSVAMTLETALQLAPFAKEIRNRVRFAFWGAEEEGLYGSTYYVSRLTDEERRRTSLNLNFETIASPNFARLVYHGSGPVPPGTGTVEQVLLDRFAARGLPTAPLEFDGRSDFVPFIAAGIPAGGGSSGYNQVKSPEWQRLFGGQAGRIADPCYHQRCDALEHLDRTILGQLGDALAWATGRFAVDTADVERGRLT
ncbi:M28 family peptidase [Streptomyces orinoci]|uniref:M28 family peptidase n=1 Tax=Streptomyces orinoci TaxID=67339 RepID=A0ABV3K4W4_STRON|nr:M28 family peptidase [Streptomyces orinoci]